MCISPLVPEREGVLAVFEEYFMGCGRFGWVPELVGGYALYGVLFKETRVLALYFPKGNHHMVERPLEMTVEGI